MYSSVGFGAISAGKIIQRFLAEYRKVHDDISIEEKIKQLENKKVKEKVASNGIIVKGIDNCLVKLSKCCNPLPGDNSIGFITRGHGVSIHKRDCSNVPRDLAECEEPGRWLKASWDNDVKFDLNTTLSIFCIDREDLISDILKACYELRISITNVGARVLKSGNSIVTLGITVENTDHLNNFLSRLKKIDNVVSVERVIH